MQLPWMYALNYHFIYFTSLKKYKKIKNHNNNASKTLKN